MGCQGNYNDIKIEAAAAVPLLPGTVLPRSLPLPPQKPAAALSWQLGT